MLFNVDLRIQRCHFGRASQASLHQQRSLHVPGRQGTLSLDGLADLDPVQKPSAVGRALVGIPINDELKRFNGQRSLSDLDSFFRSIS